MLTGTIKTQHANYRWPSNRNTEEGEPREASAILGMRMRMMKRKAQTSRPVSCPGRRPRNSGNTHASLLAGMNWRQRRDTETPVHPSRSCRLGSALKSSKQGSEEMWVTLMECRLRSRRDGPITIGCSRRGRLPAIVPPAPPSGS
ncbi:hypothetical protein AGOR_G00245260 [Albula goreensis]|uniref:Uncharacterized protein n=1 Tax=Albula goreensis TaxID=1534307 RepID=A0A8T3CGY5_9TELE|nr:hypothetical protein AGOR_G00245260 [Albula goreensis]